MLNYLAAFIFYTMAMIGVLLIAFLVYKKTNIGAKVNNKGMIKIIDSCPVGNKKSLLVVKIKNERFLIASGMEHTTFLAKLENNNNDEKQNNKIENISRVVPEIVSNDDTIAPPKMQNNNISSLQGQLKQLYFQRELNKIQNDSEFDKKRIIKQLIKELDKTPDTQMLGEFNG